MFETVQRTRKPRVRQLIEIAHKRQKLEAMDTPDLKSYVTTRIPSLPIQVIYNEWLKTIPQATSLDMLPLPTRPHRVPYHDELKAQETMHAREGSKI